MLRKTLAVMGLAAVSLIAAPAAMAYAPPDAPTIEQSGNQQVEPGDSVPFILDNFLPGSQATFTVAADGVDGGDIGLVVMGSQSVHALVGTGGGFKIGVTFPSPAKYTLSATGLDQDGNSKTVGMSLEVFAAGTALPHTGFTGRDVAVGGIALIAAGISAIVLGRRRSSVLV